MVMLKERLQTPKEGKVRRSRHGLYVLFMMGIMTAGVLVPIEIRQAAANDDPVVSGSTATYSGNQQPNAITQNNTSIYNIVVNNLTTNVGPQSTAMSLTNMGGNSTKEGGAGGNSQPLTLNYSGGSYNLLGTNYGSYLNTIAGNGSEGAESKGAGDQTGKPGGDGGTGGSVTVTTSGAIQATTTGVAASSSGGTAGKGGEGNGNICKGTGGAGGTGGNGGDIQITGNGPVFTIGAGGAGILGTSQGGVGGEGGDSKGAKEVGGDGGVGGAGGNVTITNNGGITTSGTNAYGISAQSAGGAGGEGHDAGSAGGMAVRAALGGQPAVSWSPTTLSLPPRGRVPLASTLNPPEAGAATETPATDWSATAATGTMEETPGKSRSTSTPTSRPTGRPMPSTRSVPGGTAGKAGQPAGLTEPRGMAATEATPPL
jgi:hypothetical protein